MKVLITHDVGNDYICKVVLTANNRLAVRMENSDGGYIGQLFTTFYGVFDTYKSMSSGTELTDEELATIKSAANISESMVSKLSEVLVNKLPGILKVDIKGKGTTFKKGSSVMYHFDDKIKILVIDFAGKSVEVPLDDDEYVDEYIKD